MGERKASREKEVVPESEHDSWFRRYERPLVITLLSLLVVSAAYAAGRDLIERSDQTIVERMNEATDSADGYLKTVGDGFDDAKTRFDAAKKQCAVIDELAPQISVIASAIGTTTTSTTTTTVPTNG